MSKVVVVAQFGRIDVGHQLAGAPDEYTIAQIQCRIVGVGEPADTFVWVKQITGSKFQDKDSLEVSRPVNYRGPLDYSRFVEAANEHFKKAIGPEGRGFASMTEPEDFD
jgi:hypothetical protein